MKRYFGVDFGTTNTAFVSYDDVTKSYENIGTEEGRPFPSIIIIDGVTGKVVHKGLKAWEKRSQFAIDKEYIVINSVKQKLSSEELWRTGSVRWTPEMVASEVLKNGIEGIKRRWPETEFPVEVVMAVPVDFKYNERVKIINAANEIGFRVKQLVSESTAAIAGCEESLQEMQNVVVFDWGGGTLDVSVLRVSKGRIKELAKRGARIGGDTLDSILSNYLHYGHKKVYPQIPSYEEIEPRQRDKILIFSELNKRLLSETLEREIYIPDYVGGALEDILDRNTFEKIILDKIDKVKHLTLETISEAKLSENEIDLVLMVGGSSQIPIIKRKMGDTFGSRCAFPRNAEWYIAKGAARLARYCGNYTLSKSVGVILSDNSFLPIIKQNQILENDKKPITLGLVEDSTEARLVIAESFSDRRTYGEYEVIDVLGIPTSGFNFEPIEVYFEFQVEPSTRVSAKNRSRVKSNEKFTIFSDLKFDYRLDSDEA